MKDLTELSDCAFVVEGETFRSHKIVLALRAPSLLELWSDDASEAVELPGIAKDMFEDLIAFMYTGSLSHEYEAIDSVLDLLEVANRFACICLKLKLEAKLVEEFLDESSAVRLFSFADSLTCALLYEASMEIICDKNSHNGSALVWDLVEESTELATQAAGYVSTRLKTEACTNDSSLDHLDVSSLRMQLYANGEDVDGSREMLVSRLANSSMVSQKDAATS